MTTNTKTIDFNDSIHSIRGHLSTILTFLELHGNTSISEEEREELLSAAKKSLSLVCSELDIVSDVVNKK